MRTVIVTGTRPNIVKAASLVTADTILIHTGQHYDYNMSKCFFKQFNITPNVNLNVQSRSLSEIRVKVKKALAKYLPCTVIIIGDVNSSLAAAQAAKSLNCPVVHVEAGLRSFDNSMPEERNRKAIDKLSDILFVPEPSGIVNLKNEKNPGRIHLVGNVAIDTLENNWRAILQNNILERLDLEPRKYILATFHRDGINGRAERINRELHRISKYTKVIFPAHPKTNIPFESIGPLGYLDFVKLLHNAEVVITDSGGVQAEAFHLGVPCVTARKSTEWNITLYNNENILAGNSIYEGYLKQKGRRVLSGTYWDGRAAERIKEIMNGNIIEKSAGSCRDYRAVSICS